MEKKVKITCYGGFHSASPIRVSIPESSAKSLKDGYSTLQDVITDYQLKRLQKHFCGVDGCRCGGIHRGVIIEL